MKSGKLLGMALLTACLVPTLASGHRDDDRSSGEITLIHMGDIHGHLLPRPNLRSDGDGRMEGGLARMTTVIKKIREDEEHSLLINTGDTTQGSGEALYTRGRALVDVIDLMGVDAFAPGNWDYVYGPDRFREFFQGGRWGALASNLYNTARKNAGGLILDENNQVVTSPAFPAGIPATLPRVHSQAQYDDWAQWYTDNGQRILPPYAIKRVGGLKVGILGCTTRRGPQVVGSWVVNGIEFSNCQHEVARYVPELRNPAGHNVDLLVLLTEVEIGVNIQMLENSEALDGDNHIDVILNSDMHEETLEPLQIWNKSRTRQTLLLEEGQDGTMLGELKLKVKNKQVREWRFKPHRIHDGIREDRRVARKIAEVLAPFTRDFDASIPCTSASPYYNTFSHTCLKGPLDEVIGSTLVGLHRSNYSDEDMPAVLEGTSHDFMADAMRWWAGSDIATVRGFRYGTHVRPGPIMRNDLYHFVPIGARVGKAGRIHAAQLRNQVDNSSQAVLSSDPGSELVENAPKNNNGWAGGWLFAYSGDSFSLKFDPYWYRNANVDSRARELQLAVPCERLPLSEQSGCTGKAVTQITNAGNGAWMPNWGATLPAPVATYALQTDPVPAGKKPWNFVTGSATRQFQLPALTVAGYWYEQSALKLNNCPNCNPLGTSGDDNDPDAPYILPVNMDPVTGGPMLDASGKPVLLRHADGSIVRNADDVPQAAGEPIELVDVIEKYLDATGPANPVQQRIKLVDGASLPGRYAHPFPVMQPLCGTLPKPGAHPGDAPIPAPADCPQN